MIKSFLSTCALALLFCSCVVQANAAFYLRPEVQFGFLADGHSDTDMGVGGALSWGGAFGKEQRYEVGVEVSRIRYKGEFDHWKKDGPGYLETQKILTTCTVTPIQAAFRYSFITDNRKLRPYLGLSLGYNWTEFDIPYQSVVWGDGFSWTGSLGGGVSYQLGRRTSVNLGYRYFFSEAYGKRHSNSYEEIANFRYNAHVFSIAITQLLGRLRK